MEVRVRDPVHNFINLDEAQVNLVGTRPLQRLRGIRQLALANLVYPGALHTRFDHTLGVSHVAGLMANALAFDNDQVSLVQLAALLHDIGHGPFSHVSEHALNRYADRDKLPADQKKEKIHEILTAHMIRNNDEIVHLIGQYKANQIAELLLQGHGQTALRSIVSGPLDADKQDYLLRDSRFCGVQYGLFDIHQMHRSLVLEGPKDEEELMIDPDGTHAIEQFVLAKYYMTTNVYRHRVRLITDQMIVRAIQLGIEHDKNEQLKRLYSFDGTREFVENYCEWDDARFLQVFGTDNNTKCAAMLKRLRERKLLKRVFKEKVGEFPAAIRESFVSMGKPENDDKRLAIEKRIAESLAQQTGKEIDSDFVIFYAFNIKSVRETSRNDEAGILVATKPTQRKFEDESTLFRSINEGYVDEFVEVYAPLEWETPTAKKQIRRECFEPIKQLIEDVCNGVLKENTP